MCHEKCHLHPNASVEVDIANEHKNNLVLNMEGGKKTLKKKRSKTANLSKPNVSDSENSDDEITDFGNGLNISLKANDDSASSDGWSSDDDRELVEKVKSISKINDRVNYKTRLKQVNWSDIAFKTHTAEDCSKRFTDHLKNVRRHRNLNEVVTDIETNIKKCPIKKPLNSYQIFIQDQLTSVTSSGDFAETMRNIASRYKSLGIEERAVYEKKANQLREEYKAKKMQFASGSMPMPLKASTPSVSKVKTPFQLYAEHHQTEGDFNQLRDQYANLSIDDKYKWVIKAVALAPENNSKVLNKDEMRIFKGQVKHSPTGYSLFVKDIHNKLRGKYGAKEIFVEIAQRWKAMDPKKKQTYIDKAAILKEKAAEEQQAFNERHGVTPQKLKRRKSVYVEKPTATVKSENDDNDDDVDDEEQNCSTPKKMRKISTSSQDSTANHEKNTKQIQIQPKSSPLKSPIKFTLPTPSKEVKKEKKQKSNSVSESSDFNEVGESDAPSTSSNSISSKKKSKKEKKGKKEKSIEPPGEKPPSTFDVYFAKFIHTGKPHKAKKALNKLTKKEVKQFKAEYNEKVESYVNHLKTYLSTLSKDDAVAYISELKRTEDADRQNDEAYGGSSSQE